MGKIGARLEWGASDLGYFINNHLFVYFWLPPAISLDTLCGMSAMQSDSAAGGATLATDGAETANIPQAEKAAGAISSQGVTARKDFRKNRPFLLDVTSLFQVQR